MGKSKRKAADPNKEQDESRSDNTSPAGNQTSAPAPESHIGKQDNGHEQPLTDRQGSPINIRPKGMDA